MRRAPAAVWVLGLVAVVLQAAALATQYFQPSLNGDYLYPQRFAQVFLDGQYPLAGAVHSPAPYFFPDLAGAIVLLVLTGGAPVLPYYAIGASVALALLFSWSLRRAGWTGWSGALAGVTVVNLLLAGRLLPGHEMYVWWLLTPGFHGGAILLGLTFVGWVLGPSEETWSRRKTSGVAALVALGAASDSLFLTQFVGPAVLALACAGGRGGWRAPRWRDVVRATVLGVAVALAFRIGCAVMGFGTFARLARYAPEPSAIVRAAQQFGRDVVEVFWPTAGGFTAMAALASLTLGILAWRVRRDAVGSPRRAAVWFAAACVLSVVVMPIVTVFWRSHFNARHLLPLLVVPLWGVLAAVAVERIPTVLRRGWLAGAAAGFLVLGFGTRNQVAVAAWQWPYPERMAEMDRFFASENRRRGLADYWQTHYVTTLSHVGVRLNQLRPDGRVYFWNNNAFTHYDVAADGRLIPAAYDFIIVDGLNLTALREKYGAPSRTTNVGGFTLWLYDGAAAEALQAKVDVQVVDFLAGRPGTARMAQPEKIRASSSGIR